MHACAAGHAAAARLLAAADGAGLRDRDAEGETCLTLAAGGGHAEVVEQSLAALRSRAAADGTESFDF